MAFRFELGHRVVIKVSGETGQITARAEYEDYGNRYLVIYKAADGAAREEWWSESQLAAA